MIILNHTHTILFIPFSSFPFISSIPLLPFIKQLSSLSIQYTHFIGEPISSRFHTINQPLHPIHPITNRRVHSFSFPSHLSQ